jgi:endonuclease YncB( thermonuclease family)
MPLVLVRRDPFQLLISYLLFSRYNISMATLSVASYAVLRKKVEETLLLGQQRIEEAKVQTYWQTGRYINEHVRVNGGRAEYGKKVTLRLSEDLDIDDSVLRRCAEFADLFPDYKICAARHKLTWAHYRALITVPDEKKRLALADQASKGEWSSRELEIEIRNLNWEIRAEASDGKAPSLLPVPVIGPFYTYRIIAPETIHSRAAEPLLDSGFSGTKKLSSLTSRRSAAGSIVTSVKDARGNYSLKAVRPQPTDHGPQNKAVKTADYGLSTMDSLYNYQAYVTNIIDGDTLKLEIDTGFDNQKHETIRLKGIDCPELDMPEGQAAKRFVERELAHCDSIILKSTQTRKEKWGRYLGDIFYNDRAGKRQYLNNRLLEEGHAVRVRD